MVYDHGLQNCFCHTLSQRNKKNIDEMQEIDMQFLRKRFLGGAHFCHTLSQRNKNIAEMQEVDMQFLRKRFLGGDHGVSN